MNNVKFFHKIKSINRNKIWLEIKKLLYGNSIVSIIGFFTIIYIGRKLPPSEYANFSIALSFFYIFRIANEPLRMLFAKFIPEFVHFGNKNKIKGLLFVISKYILCLSILLLILILIFGEYALRLLKLPSITFLYLIWIFVVAKLFLNVGRGIINGRRDYSSFNLSFYIEAGSRLILVIIILIIVKNCISAFLAYIFAAILVIPFLLLKIKDIFRYKNVKVDLYYIFSFIKPLLIFSISFMAFYSIDMFMAKAYLSGQEAGYYSAASQLSKSIAVIGSSFNVMLLPYVTEKFLNQINPLIEFLKIKGIFIVIGVLIVVFFALFSEKIISILYTEKYSDASNLLLPLGIGTLFMTLSSMIGNYFLAVRKYIAFIIPIFTVFLEISLIYIWHSSPQKISYMFLFSQSFMFIGLFITLFVVKSKYVIPKRM